MKPLIIANPASNGGRTGRLLDALRGPLERALGPSDFVRTEQAGHAREVARLAAEQGRERIVAVGGDGTFSEVADGVLVAGAAERVTLGLVHAGTGGDLRRALGFDASLGSFIGALEAGRTQRTDAARIRFVGVDGKASVRHFVNVASWGLGGIVARSVSEGSRLLGGTATYALASVRSLFSGAVGRLSGEIERADGSIVPLRMRTRIVALCNGRFFGGGMELAPQATLEDGLLDLVAVESEHRLPVVRAMGAVYAGRHLSMAGVVHERARRVTLTLDNADESDRFLLEVDGEYAGRGPITVEVLPKALNVIVPAGAPSARLDPV